MFTVQDNYAAPSEPTVSMPFTKYGVQDFVVEYWTGSAWAAVPGGTVTNNTRVWRQFNFTPLTTSKIRVSVSRGMASRSRLVEVEAYAVFGSVNQAPEVTVTSPPDGAAVPTGAAVSLEATASDADGTVSRVDFQVNGTTVGTDTTAVGGVFTTTWTPSLAGSYTVTAVATDDDGATRTSNPVAVVVTPPPGRVNVALAANGGTAVASSTDSSSFPTIGAINGDRKGLQWGSGGGWQDGTANAWPDWLEVRFDAARTIEEVDVFTVQDNYAAPLEPTVSMTFTKYGVQDFVVEYWTGSAWAPVPGGTVTNNTRVWRQFSFTPLTTSKIRVSVTRAMASRTRLVEVEAYAVSGTVNLAPTVTLTSPANNASVPVGAVVPLEATASDADGTVSKVDFLVNGATVGTDTSAAGAVFTATWTAALAGSYTVTAVATDDDGATRTSNPVTVVVTPPAGRVNVALATNGGTAVASSTDSTGAFPTSGVINGDRKGLQWGSGGGWQDGTAAVWPDWLEVRFDGARTIEEIDVFTVQDNYAAPLEPTLSMTFTKYGLQDFVVEYWTGSAWAPVPGATVTNNNRVWRQFNFTPLTTSKIRVSVTRALASRSRVVEVEAFTTIGG